MITPWVELRSGSCSSSTLWRCSHPVAVVMKLTCSFQSNNLVKQVQNLTTMLQSSRDSSCIHSSYCMQVWALFWSYWECLCSSQCSPRLSTLCSTQQYCVQRAIRYSSLLAGGKKHLLNCWRQAQRINIIATVFKLKISTYVPTYPCLKFTWLYYFDRKCVYIQLQTPPIQLVVQSPDGSHFPATLRSSAKGIDLASLVEAQLGIPCSEQLLLWQRKKVELKKLLIDQNISTGSVIYVKVKLNGGSGMFTNTVPEYLLKYCQRDSPYSNWLITHFS